MHSDYQPISTNTYPLTKEDLKPSDVWLFYRKVLRRRCWRPLFRVIETYRYKGKLRGRVRFLFEHERNNEIFCFNLSRHEPIYFTVARGSKVFTSEMCSNYSELETCFCKYFFRRSPILPRPSG